MNYYENKIYIQTDSDCVRNKAINNVNTSSDLCVFNIPFFTMSGGSKIDCIIESCDISGVTYDDILTATTNCFITNELSGTCFNDVVWNTNIYQDSVLVSTETFYTSSTLTDSPTLIDFSGSVVTSFDTLGYDYTFNGTKFTIIPDGFTEVRLDIDTTLNFDNNCPVTGVTSLDISCSCPSGYTPTMGNECLYSATTAATFNGSGATITAGDTNVNYSEFGAYFYSNETNNPNLPLVRNTTTGNISSLTDQIGGLVNATNVSNSTFWDANGSNSNGRLNNAGVSATPTNEWVGFSDCFDITSNGTYYIGIAADNFCRVSIDGHLFVTLEGVSSTDKNFKIWHVLPYDFIIGTHIIEMEGKNAGSDTSFGAEIYNPTDLATLTGATTTGDTGLIFSTANKVGDYFDLGDTVGYSCPSGYALDMCSSGTPICAILDYTNETCVFTGSCPDYNEIICDLEMNYLNNESPNVHILTGQTEINLDFTFTGNTDSFIDNNTTFKFDIYKYDNTLNNYHTPAQYSSDNYEWDSFSGSSALTVSIPITTLNVDGEYLIKGNYIYDTCTEFSSKLGLRNDTSEFISGTEYGIYDSNLDYYMVVFKEASKPMFSGIIDNGGSIGAIKQYTIIPTDGQTTFLLDVNVGLDFIVTLNGLTLANNEDYSVTQYTGGTNGYVVTLISETYTTDILTIIYTSSGAEIRLQVDTIDVLTIPSGPIDGQGDNLVYYNTSKNKFEVYTSITPRSGNNFLVSVNGVTLTYGVDYYQSISNPKRLIFNGTLLIGDIIVIGYNSNAPYIGSITENEPTIFWNIGDEPQLVNGEFTLELSTDSDMTTIISNNKTNYIVGELNYNDTLIVSGAIGTMLYYRVVNNKNFVTMCGNIITSTAYSEIIPITIATNSINSY